MKSQTRLSVRSINQSNRSISVRLSFLFCSRAFISRSYENRSIKMRKFDMFITAVCVLVVARWNPSEGGDRGGLETRATSVIFGS